MQVKSGLKAEEISYMTPKSALLKDSWLTALPVGKNKLSKMIKQWLKKASLWQTTAFTPMDKLTYMFTPNVPKKLLMEGSGNCSSMSVSYSNITSIQQTLRDIRIEYSTDPIRFCTKHFEFLHRSACAC